MFAKISKYSSILLIIATALVTVYRVVGSTEDIILHWDFAGNVTDYGSRYALIAFPFIAMFLYLVSNSYRSHPYDLFRPSTRALIQSDRNEARIKRCIDVINPLIALLMLYVTLCSAQYLPLNSWLLCAVIIGILVYVVTVRHRLARKS